MAIWKIEIFGMNLFLFNSTSYFFSLILYSIWYRIDWNAYIAEVGKHGHWNSTCSEHVGITFSGRLWKIL